MVTTQHSLQAVNSNRESIPRPVAVYKAIGHTGNSRRRGEKAFRFPLIGN